MILETTLWSISFSIDETLNDSGYLRRVSDHECLHIRQSVWEVLWRIHAYDTAQLKKLLERTLEVTCLNKFAQCVATNQKTQTSRNGQFGNEMNGYERICYMLKYGVIPLLSNFKKSTSQSVPRFANLNMGSQKGIESKKDSPFVCLKKWMHPNVCFFFQALDTEILKSDSTQLGFRAGFHHRVSGRILDLIFRCSCLQRLLSNPGACSGR